MGVIHPCRTAFHLATTVETRSCRVFTPVPFLPYIQQLAFTLCSDYLAEINVYPINILTAIICILPLLTHFTALMRVLLLLQGVICKGVGGLTHPFALFYPVLVH